MSELINEMINTLQSWSGFDPDREEEVWAFAARARDLGVLDCAEDWRAEADKYTNDGYGHHKGW